MADLLIMTRLSYLVPHMLHLILVDYTPCWLAFNDYPLLSPPVAGYYGFSLHRWVPICSEATSG